jgi:hypothetical protein
MNGTIGPPGIDGDDDTGGLLGIPTINATPLNNASTIVQRDASGEFSAGSLKLTGGKVNIGMTGSDYNSLSAIENFQVYKKFDISTMGGMDTGETTFFSGDIVNGTGTSQIYSANIFSCIADNDGATTTHNYSLIDGADIGALAGYSYIDGGRNWKGSAQVTGARFWAKNLSSNDSSIVLAANGIEVAAVGNYGGHGATRSATGLRITQVEATGNLGGTETQPHTAYGIYIDNYIMASNGSTNTAYSIYSASTASSYFAGGITAASFSGPLTGTASGLNSTGDVYVNGTLLGRGSGNLATNLVFGGNALGVNVDGYYNIALGYHSLYANDHGYYNVGVGGLALSSNLGGWGNLAIGYAALVENTTGTSNVAIGFGSGYNGSVSLKTNSNSTYIGANANASADGLTNSTAIGANSQVTASNQIVLGNSSVTATKLGGGSLQVPTGFGCNSKTPQTAYASGGAAGGTPTLTTGYGFVSAAEMNAFVTLVANLRTALVNQGTCS